MNMLLNALRNAARMRRRKGQWLSVLALLFVLGLLGFVPSAATAAPGDLYGPPGSRFFGNQVVVLTNGNFVVTDPNYDLGSRADVGAIYLYNGATHQMVSKLTGDTVGDRVGIGQILALKNGNFVVANPNWHNIGAVTWINGTTGLSGTVSGANSLVGSTAGDNVGYFGLVALTNDNYVVRSLFWDAPGVEDAGAVTWGNGAIGITGIVSITNSLIGSSAQDMIGEGGVTPLQNGNYVVSSPIWNVPGMFNGPGDIPDAGAVTWGNGATGTVGLVSSENSLVGSRPHETVGNVTALTNGNYVVCSPNWQLPGTLSAGAATWGNGAIGISGEISGDNSLLGGCSNVTALTNGNYVVGNPTWVSAQGSNVGAATWGDGTRGITGEVSTANSLIGNQSWAYTGYKIVALSNGNYVVVSSSLDASNLPFAGAVTWGDGQKGTVGVGSSTNSLVGTQSNEMVGDQVVALTNGNYVVTAPAWGPGVTERSYGAITWVNGSASITGVVSTTNSLVGSHTEDSYLQKVIALSNGNYVISSPYWDASTTTQNVGAVTWGNGTTGTVGSISAANSLVGTSANDLVGWSSVALRNGNYVAVSPEWSVNTTSRYVGAVTWGNGIFGTVGGVSGNNSLVGSTLGDRIGRRGIVLMPNGDYIVHSPSWRTLGKLNVGSVTWGNGTIGTSGTVLDTPSIKGEIGDAGYWWPPAQYNPVYHQIIAGIPGENRVGFLQMIYFTSMVPPGGEVDWPYQYTLTATGSPAPRFRVAQGSLPPGLVLEPTGVLHGTPTQAGVFAFTVVASNGLQPEATQQFTFTVARENNHTWLPVAGR